MSSASTSTPIASPLLARGESFIEDVPDNELRRHLDSRRYRLSADVAGLDGFDVAVISVPTPSREGLPDIAYIEQASVFKTVVLVALVRACNDGIVDPRAASLSSRAVDSDESEPPDGCMTSRCHGMQYAVAVFTRSDFVTKRQPMVDQLIGEAAHLAVELLRHP